jgi:hypothetical protein
VQALLLLAFSWLLPAFVLRHLEAHVGAAAPCPAAALRYCQSACRYTTACLLPSGALAAPPPCRLYAGG